MPKSTNQIVSKVVVPKAGPEPLLLSRKEIDVLYEVFDVVHRALALLGVEYIVTGGSLLGAIRQHSILFCDDDIDIAIIDRFDDSGADNETRSSSSSSSSLSVYESVVVPKLQSALDAVVADESNDCTNRCVYQIKPWEGGDRIRSKRYNSVFLDLFVLRKYPTLQSFVSIVGVKRNGQAQPESYVRSLLEKIRECTAEKSNDSDNSDGVHNFESMFPFWQFSTRKAIEMWPKEVYRTSTDKTTRTGTLASHDAKTFVDELFPLQTDLKFGPLTGVCGPNMPVTLLKRAFGDDCFDVYYRSVSHHQAQAQAAPPPLKQTQNGSHHNDTNANDTDAKENGAATGKVSLPPLVAPGGTWEDSPKVPLEDEHYLPLQPLARKRRRPTMHCKERLLEYLNTQAAREAIEQEALLACRSKGGENGTSRPNETVYMDGVFDLFHVGHLEAIRQCAALGTKVILGVTGDDDATGYKRQPIVPQDERVAIVSALREVDQVVCPCPLVVTKEFMDTHEIDLVVHGFANDADAERQKEFFAIPIAMGKFQRIGYYRGLSTTDRIRIIQERDGQQPLGQGSSSDVSKEVVDEKRIKEQDGGNRQQEEPATRRLPPVDGELSNNDAKPEAVTNRAIDASESKPQWFGACVAAATNNAPLIPTDPFPLSLRNAIESHIDKARRRRRDAINAIRVATGESVYDSVMNRFLRQQEHLRVRFGAPLEAKASRDPFYGEDLVASLLVSASLPPGTDLSRLHELPLVDGRSAKDRLLHSLTQNPGPFRKAYDAYVRNVCIPRMTSAMDSEPDSPCEEIYYQVFPCLRIIQPDEFSIGPHADVAYGHHPCSINCYVTLTDPGIDAVGNYPESSTASMSVSMSSSLFLESRPGAEDWHALFPGKRQGRSVAPRLELFAGAMNLHWTTENKTPRTRVSLDFRLLDGRVFHALECGGHLEGGQQDVYRKTPGYYHRCIRSNETAPQTEPRDPKPTWIRDENYFGGGDENGGELTPPDFRVGFPWTVKNWEKFWKKNTKSG